MYLKKLLYFRGREQARPVDIRDRWMICRAS
nr:MAG TPA: hypothetical protein [Caudoviricetes sp.]